MITTCTEWRDDYYTSVKVYCSTAALLLVGFGCILYIHVQSTNVGTNVIWVHSEKQTSFTDESSLQQSDDNSCQTLLQNGSVNGRYWLPHGCTMLNYDKRDVEQCAWRATNTTGRRNHIVFIGDSRVREQYLIFCSAISRHPYVVTTIAFHHNDQFFDNDTQILVEFYWQPNFDDWTLKLFKQWLVKPPDERPRVIVIGNVLWHLKAQDASGQVFSAYKASLVEAVPLFDFLRPTTKVIWMVQAAALKTSMPLPNSYAKDEFIDRYNDVAYRTFAGSSVYIWSASRQIAQSYTRNSPDGLHLLRSRALVLRAQMLLNFYCNQFVDVANSTSVCCSRHRALTFSQKML